MPDVSITLSVDDSKLADDLTEIAGVNKGPVPLAQVCRLAELHDAIADEETLEDGAAAPLYVPDLVRLAGLDLRRPSLGALMIIERAAAWNVTDRWTAVHTACVLHSVDNPATLRALARLDTADTAVADFAPRCRFDEAAWRDALATLMHGIDPDDIGKGAKKNWTRMATPSGGCVCIRGVSRGFWPQRREEPRDIGCGRFRRARRWLRSAILRGAERLRRPMRGTSGAPTTRPPSASTSANTEG